MQLVTYTEPAEEPVSLEEAKAHLRVVNTAEDDLIAGLVVAARQQCEDEARRAFVTRTYDLTLDCWPVEPLRLPRQPLGDVISVTYIDSTGNTNTVDESTYETDSERMFLAYGKSWPSATLRPYSAVTIRYTAGYGNASDVPARYKQAMLLLIGHWFQNRESVVVGAVGRELPMAVKALLHTDRNY